MKIKTKQDAIKFLKNFDKQLEAICSEFKCGSSCPFFINDDCIISESGPINVDGACQAILDSMEEPPQESVPEISIQVSQKFSKETSFTVKNDFIDVCDGCPMSKYEVFCGPCKERMKDL